MSKDPAFLFYYKDFENDTADWEADEIGWYIRLLIFQAGNGYIPEDTEKIAQVARVKYSEYLKFSERWASRLACKFISLSDGKIYNRKLAKIQSERKSGAIKKSVLAVFGNFIKSSNLSATEERELKKSFHSQDHFYDILQSEERKVKILKFLNNETLLIKQRYAKRTQQGDAIENEDVNKDKVENGKITIWPDFEDFWNEYDKKIGSKPKIQSKWDKLSQKTKEEIMAYIPDYKISQPDKQFRKNPETFFNNQSWKDEIIKSNENRNNSNNHRNKSSIQGTFDAIDSMLG